MTEKPLKVRNVWKLEKRTNKHKLQKIHKRNDPGDDGDGDDDGNYNDNGNTTLKSGMEKPVKDNTHYDGSSTPKSGSREPIDNSTLNLGVSDNDESLDETEEAAKPSMNGVDMNLDELYWNNNIVATETN